MNRVILAFCCALLASCAGAETRLVSTQHEYRQAVKTLVPGDTILLANGEWRDFEILFQGKGTADRPISLGAETKGKVVITGKSNVRMAGEHLIVSGLIFRDGHTPTNTVISFRRTVGDLAYHSRVTETVIDRFNNPERHEPDFWVMMYGKHNRFDHNYLVGKSNIGVTMAVRLDSEDSRENHHRIDHNYFGPRPILGSNGGETLRIGTSHYATAESRTLIENNYFERCNGEVEIISIKSGGNRIRGNLFFESRGTLTFRHGNGNLAESNVFLGNGVAHTGGIRVINADQVVRNNYLYGLTGRRFGGALVVMNGVPNSPANRYMQVENALIERNSIIDSHHIELAAGSDEERTAVPSNSVFRSNLIHNQDKRSNFRLHDDISGIEFRGNALHDVHDPPIKAGFVNTEIELQAAGNGLLYPVIQADQTLAEVGVSRNLTVLERSDTGVSWYPKPGAGDRFDQGATIAIQPGLDALAKAATEANPGDAIELAPGTYRVSRTIVLRQPLTIRASAGAARIEFERSALFEIADGGSLQLDGVRITGRAAPDVAGNAVIRTSRRSMLGNYALIVRNASIENLDVNHSFNFLSSAKHTFADRIEIIDSTFRDITGHVLSLAQETDDLGLYSGESVSISDSRFDNIGGALADIYRGGTDESTFGPHFSLRASRLTAVGNGPRNRSKAAVRLHGVQNTRIVDNDFVDSLPIRVALTVGEPVMQMSDNRFVQTPVPIINGTLAPRS